MSENVQLPGTRNGLEILRVLWAESVGGRKVHIERDHSLGMRTELEKVLHRQVILGGNGGSKTKLEDVMDLRDPSERILLQRLPHCLESYWAKVGVNRIVPRVLETQLAKTPVEDEMGRREEAA